MPIPFILGALGVAAASIVGVGGHLSAKETNEQAERVAKKAKEIYDNEKLNLETEKNETESSLLDLGYKKKAVIDTSMAQFVTAYEKIKHIQINYDNCLNELSLFNIDDTDVLEICQMTETYAISKSDVATGASVGALITLAASGALPVVAGSLSAAGGALLAGNIGAATSFAGGAVSAAFAPLATIAAPVLAITGIASSMKADENLSKAMQMHAEAEAAVEEMKTMELKCFAISKRAEMYSDLLIRTNYHFKTCVDLLDNVIRKRSGLFGNKKIKQSDLTNNEIEVIAVTRSLASTIKAILDTPILDSEGELCEESEKIENIFEEQSAIQLQTQDLVEKMLPGSTYDSDTCHNFVVPKPNLPEAIRNVFSIFVGITAGVIINNLFGWILAIAAMTGTTLMLMNNHSTMRFFRGLRTFYSILYALCPCAIFATQNANIGMSWQLIVGGVILLIIWFLLFSVSSKKSFVKFLERTLVGSVVFVIGILIFSLLCVIGLPTISSTIICEILMVPASLFLGVLLCNTTLSM